jgi:uncharacterized protein involved in propanediol utilization
MQTRSGLILSTNPMRFPLRGTPMSLYADTELLPTSTTLESTYTSSAVPMSRAVEADGIWTTYTQRVHFGELIQVKVYGYDGKPTTVLITLPAPHLSVTVQVRQTSGLSVSVTPSHYSKVKRAVELALQAAGAGESGCEVRVCPHPTLPESVGLGTSTGQVLAAIRAVFAMLGFTPQDDLEVQEIAFDAEGPNDPLVATSWGTTAVYASRRRGYVHQVVPRPLPPMVAVGCVTDLQGHDTVKLKNEDTWTPADLRVGTQIVNDACRAILNGDAAALARAATRSARANQPRLPTRHWKELRTLLRRIDALGIAISHSGSTATYLFAPDDLELSRKIRETKQALEEMGVDHIQEFKIGRRVQTPAPEFVDGSDAHNRESIELGQETRELAAPNA